MTNCQSGACIPYLKFWYNFAMKYTCIISNTFQKPISLDHVVEMEIQLPRTSYGPGDLISCHATLTGNPDWEARVKKVRAEKLIMWIEQIVTYRLQQDVPCQSRTKKIAETKWDFGGMKLIDKPLTQRLTLPFPSPDLRDKSGLVKTSDSLSTTGGYFTTQCKLYSVEYQVIIKATFKGAKDIICTTPIVASQYNLATSQVILENIESAVYEAAEIDVVSGLCGEAHIRRMADLTLESPERKRTVIME